MGKENNLRMNKITVCTIIAIAIMAIGMNLYYNFRNLDSTLDFTEHTKQHIYMDEFQQAGMLPDAYIRELIKDKRVIVPYTVKDYMAYSETAEEDRDSDFKQVYYRENNYVRYFCEYAGECEVNEGLPKIDTVKEMHKEGLINDAAFTDMGIANDMLRYSFLLNKEATRESSYFWYAWFYHTFSSDKGWESRVYIRKDEVEASRELVALWDRKENLYLMEKDYYDNVIAPACIE